MQVDPIDAGPRACDSREWAPATVPAVTQTASTSATREYGKSAGLLSVGFGVTGVLVYVYFALSSHTLDPEDYGDLVVLWSAVYVASLTLFRPVEQLLARSLAEHAAGRTPGVNRVLRVSGSIQAAVVILAVLIVLALRPVIEDELLSGATPFAVLVAALAAFGASYYLRGFLAGTGRFAFYAVLLIVEGVMRLGFALVVAVGLSDDPNVIMIGVAAAPLLSLLAAPIALMRRGRTTLAEPGRDGAQSEEFFSLLKGGGFAGALLLVMFSEQVIVSSGPLFVRSSEGAAAAGLTFNILMVARAPLLLFQAIATSLLPHLTRLRTRRDEAGAQAFAVSVRTTIWAIAAFAAAVVLGVAAIGPDAVQLAFGEKYEYDRLGLVLVAIGMGFYLSAVTLNQAALAQGQARRAATCWVGCALLFIVINLLPGIEAVRAVEIGFIVTAATLCLALFRVYSRPHPDVERALEVDSAAVVEARLAAADEIG